ncbi:MAG: L,D-transpeptidase, partial [Deltaproteobacteria bacterium]|nr:L,D-transpeptidase [Deltaproteobacteria bacterium]
MIGPDEWLDARTVGQVYVDEPKPEGITGDRWIMVNLFEQTVAIYENNQLVFATLTATGLDQYMTRPGLFKITEKTL